ncbi:MAG: helix-turn-helix domain-containing protein [Anaerotignum sp.]|nr:helix-turn-helix domain-containing protein [Anaerotignum sp.]
MIKNPEENINAEENLLCPIRYALGIVGGKWKMPILCMLSKGKAMRYSSIKRRLGNVTNMMLAQSLKELEAAGIVHREQYNEIPPRVEYTLTEKRNSMVPVLAQFGMWGAENIETKNLRELNCSIYKSSERKSL